MAATFDPALTSGRDQIRFAIAETASTSPIADETIDALVSSSPTINLAAARCCDFLAAYYARKATDISVGDEKTKYINRAEFFADMARKYRSGEITVDGQPVTGFAIGSLTEPTLTDYKP